MSFSCTFIVLKIKLISIWKVVHQDSFWNRGKRQLGNGLFRNVRRNCNLGRTFCPANFLFQHLTISFTNKIWLCYMLLFRMYLWVYVRPNFPFARPKWCPSRTCVLSRWKNYSQLCKVLADSILIPICFDIFLFPMKTLLQLGVYMMCKTNSSFFGNQGLLGWGWERREGVE